MTTEFLGNMFYFEDDKEKRDVYQVKLERAGESFTFRFGQSITNSGDKVKRNPKGHTMYDAELISRPGGRIAPTAYDVLSCVQKYDAGTFSDFCGEFGYDTDSRKAEKTYFAVQDEFSGINRIFGDVIEELQEIN
jgi:hypothetical protein